MCNFIITLQIILLQVHFVQKIRLKIVVRRVYMMRFKIRVNKYILKCQVEAELRMKTQNFSDTPRRLM